jgi:hypothetical protein
MSKEIVDEKDVVLHEESIISDKDLSTYHETHAGSLVLDPVEARVEFGDEVASRLKLSPDGKTVLWPQPTDDPEDPQNWSERRKTVQLIIITLASVVPDFDSAIGIASIFALAEQYDTTTGQINNLTSKYVSSSVTLAFGGMLLAPCSHLPFQLEHLPYRMGWPSCGDAHAALWALASALLVAGSCAWLPYRLRLRT